MKSSKAHNLRSKLFWIGTFAVLAVLWSVAIVMPSERLSNIGKPDAIPFTGKLINHSSPQFVDSKDFSGLTNFRYFDYGIGTRLGTANWSTNAESTSRKQIEGIWRFPQENKDHIIVASCDTSNITYWQIQGKTFSASVSLYSTALSSVTSTKISTAFVRDTFFIGDKGGITAFAGASVFPTALLVESGASIFQDYYDNIYSASTPVTINSGNTIHVGYSRPFNRFQADSLLDQMDNLASSVTETLKSGKMRHWLSYYVPYGSTGYMMDGYFVSGTTSGWKDGANNQSSVTSNGVGGGNCIQLSYIGAGADYYTSKPVTGFTIGNKYEFSCYYKKGTAGNGLIALGSTAGDADYWNTGVLSSTSWEKYSYAFTGVSTGLYVTLKNLTGTAGYISYYDSIEFTDVRTSSFYLPKIECRARQLGTSWDGKSWAYPDVAGFEKTGTSEFQDYTLDVRDNSEETAMDISQMTSGGTITFGWLDAKPRLVHLYMSENYKNDNASVMTAYYWDGSSYVSVSSLSDGTKYDGKTFKNTGVLDFSKITNWKKRKVGQRPYDVYPLIIKVSATLSNYVRIHKVAAIPDYDNPSTASLFKGVATNHNRLWLYDGRDKAKLIVSAENQPDCFIGADSVPETDPLLVGKQEKWMYVGPLGADTIAMKETENWIITGINPGSYIPKPLYGTVPCVAPNSVVLVEYKGKPFIIYLGRDGVYAIDASGNNPKLSEDIKAYWEPGNSLELSYDILSNAKAWYSKVYDEYHVLIGLKELVFNLRREKWSLFERDSGCRLTSGTYLMDANNNRYELGGGSGGTIFQLESGTSDYGQDIISDLTRGALTLGNRMGTRNELRGVSLKYDLPSATSITSNTLYLTSSLSSTATTYSSTFTLTDEGWKFISLADSIEGTKGYTNKRRYRFPGRINLYGEMIWSRELPWAR